MKTAQLINFEVTALDPTLFTIQPTIGTDGTLSFETAPDVNSLNADLRVTVQLVDSGASGPAPNTNVSDLKTFSVVVNPVNDPPTADAFSADSVEDTSLTLDPADVLVGDVPGPTIDEQGQTLKISQVVRTSTAGGTVDPVFGDPLDPNRITSFTYVPPIDFVGADTFLYVVTDDGVPPRSGTGTITINVAPINDAPQFTVGPNEAVSEDAGLVSVPNWATNVLPGPDTAADELANQTVSFNVSASAPELFSVQPAVSSDGTLTFTTATDANGIAVVTLFAMDDGPGDAPNVNTSASQSFTITINPINDAPVFTAGPDVTVDEDSPAYSEPWATDIAPAAGLLNNPQTALDEATQAVEFETTTDQPELFSLQPTISSTGQLQFTPARDAFGVAVVTVEAVDRGPANALDQNRSQPHSLTITISALNDAPVAVNDEYTTDEDTVLSVQAPGVLVNDTDVDLPNDALFAVAETIESESGATVTINEDGSLTYDPTGVLAFQQLTAGQSVTDRFVYRLRDQAGAESLPAAVDVLIVGLDDAPQAGDDFFSIGVGQSILLDVLANDTDIDSTIDPRTIEITASPGFGTVEVNETGVVRYTADPGFRGTDTFSYTVLDDSGNVSNEATVTVTVNSAPQAGG